jgi:hypothetical protein
VGKPEAEPGNLCVYENFLSEASFVEFEDAEDPAVANGAGSIGALLEIAAKAGGLRAGTWAVTAG